MNNVSVTAPVRPLLPHACEYCQKKFKKRYNLKIHLRSHTGEAAVACSYPGCHLKFKWRSSMINHLRYHDPTGTHMPKRKTASTTNKASTLARQDTNASSYRGAVSDVAPTQHQIPRDVGRDHCMPLHAKLSESKARPNEPAIVNASPPTELTDLLTSNDTEQSSFANAESDVTITSLLGDELYFDIPFDLSYFCGNM